MSVETTILYENGESQAGDAIVDGDDLWLRLDDLARVSGWELKPEGACREDICMPIPDDRRGEFVRGEGGGARFNLAALARLLEKPVLHDDAAGVWCIGDDARSRGAQLASLAAPDFTLPDLSGRTYTLSDFRGKKIFLVAWASW